MDQFMQLLVIAIKVGQKKLLTMIMLLIGDLERIWEILELMVQKLMIQLMVL
jgi:hypothetical protein